MDEQERSTAEAGSASLAYQDSETAHGTEASMEQHAEGDRSGTSNDAKAYGTTFNEQAIQGAIVVADVNSTDNPNQGVTQVITNWHETHQIVRGEVQERREPNQEAELEVAKHSPEADTVYFGHLRRWRCSYRAGEPSWGLIFSDIHSCDIVFAQQDTAIDFHEGDLCAFQNVVREDGYCSAGKAWKISYEELENIRMRLSDSEVPLRNSQAIDLPVNSEPENPPVNHQPVAAAPPVVESRHRAHDQYPSEGQMPLMPAHPAFPAQVQAHVIPHHQLQQACGTVPAGARQAPLSYAPPQPQPQQQQQPQPQVQQPPPGYPGFERTGSYQEVQHHVQPPIVGQGTQQWQQQQQRSQQPATRILVEPPPMLDKFDAKATALALQSGQWRGKPRTWQVSLHNSTSFQIGQEWLEALQQGISAMHAAHIEEEQQQAQQHAAAAAAWGGASPQQWMWNNNSNGVDMLPCF